MGGLVADWIHPSVRDMIVEHLMQHDSDRERFLQTTTEAGILLALSSAGGAKGARALPLLTVERDWTALQLRTNQLIQTSSIKAHWLIMNECLALLSNESQILSESVTKSVAAFGCSAIVAMADRWNRQSEVLPTNLIDTFFRLSVALHVHAHSPMLEPTWNHSISALASAVSGSDPEEVLSCAEDHFGLVDALVQHEPRFVRVMGWPEMTMTLTSDVAKVLANAIEEFPDLDPWETEWIDVDGENTVEVPAEPSSDEIHERAWLDRAQIVIEGLMGVIKGDGTRLEDVLDRCKEHWDIRERRRDRWYSEGPHSWEPPDEHYPSRNQGAGDFDLDDFFADL